MYTADADRGVKLAGHAPAGLQYLRARTQVLRHSATPIASRVMFTAAKAFFRLRSWLPWDIPRNAPLRISHRRANSNSDLAKWTCCCHYSLRKAILSCRWLKTRNFSKHVIVMHHFSCFIFHFGTHSRCLLNHCKKSCTIWAKVVAHGSDG